LKSLLKKYIAITYKLQNNFKQGPYFSLSLEGHRLTCPAVIFLFTKNAITSITGTLLRINEATASAKCQLRRNHLSEALYGRNKYAQETSPPVNISKTKMVSDKYSLLMQDFKEVRKQFV
jgi:hypothetical protein